MGHERIGVLPRSRQWRSIVSELAGFPADDDVSEVAADTLECVRERFRRIHEDSGVRASFEFIVALAATGGSDKPPLEWSDLPVSFATNPSPLRIAQALRKWVSERPGSLEYREIAERAATDAIAVWHSRQREQGYLFGPSDQSENIWGKAADGAGFSELSRLFFAKFTERYLNYFLEREASAVLPTLLDREHFQGQVRAHVDSVSRHAFETAKITQSFAAGWYNRNAREKRPSDRQVKRFLSVAFGKIREELLREGTRS